MLHIKSRLALLAVLAPALFLSACDPAEQGRVLNYEKGTYLGKKDQALTDQVKEDLRQRAMMQKGT
jgi:hypothetical protein